MARIVGIKPSAEMATAARNGLNLYEQYGRGESKNRLILAHKIANRKELDATDWRNIAGFHARYYGNDNPSIARNYDDGGPDARYAAAEMLGGDAGQDMSLNVIPKVNEMLRNQR